MVSGGQFLIRRTAGIIWLQDDNGVSGEVGAFINVRASLGVWNRTLLYDYIANPPSGVDPSTTELTNLSCSPQTDPGLSNLGTIFGVTGLLGSPHQNYSVAFPQVTPAAATELDGANNACVDFNYQSGSVPQGAWLIAGVWWTVMQLPRAFQGDGHNHLRVYKSTDFSTWTAVDTANEIIANNAFTAAWAFDGVGTIAFCYKDPSANINLKEFTISGSTGAWGADHGTLSSSNIPYMMAYSPVGPTWHVVFENLSSQPVYGYSDGTSWTFPSITLLQGNWTSIASYVLLDPNGTTLHIVAGNKYNQVTAGGVLSITADLAPLVPSGSMTFGGRGSIVDDTLFFPTTDNGTGKLYCIVSSGPLSAPTFAGELVDDAFHAEGGNAEESISIAITSTVTQTLELTKIVEGGPAVPGDFTLTAVGGTDTISGAGHVGPTEVTADTYELSEIDGSGATWGDATWGESTWGGDYIPGAWNCGGATMPTPTSVIVPPGGTVACTITNTFEGPTPPPPPPPAGSDAVGCFELLRVDITLTPARHLPVRGSTK